MNEAHTSYTQVKIERGKAAERERERAREPFGDSDHMRLLRIFAHKQFRARGREE